MTRGSPGRRPHPAFASAAARAALAALLSRHGLADAPWQVIADIDCTVLRLRPASGREFALRIYPATKTDRAPVDLEVAWLAALAEAGECVPSPQADADGEIVHRWPGGRWAVLFGWVGGRLLDRGLRPVHLQRAGRLIATMHEKADALVAAGRIAPIHTAHAVRLADWADGTRPRHPAWPARARADATRVAQGLQARIARLPRRGPGWGLTHTDLHLWNLVHASPRCGAIDFSDCGWHWRAMDLAGPLQYLQRPLAGNTDHSAAYPRLREALLAGYAERRSLPPHTESQIDDLLTARWFLTLEWILDDWPRVDLRPFGPALLRGAAAMFARLP